MAKHVRLLLHAAQALVECTSFGHRADLGRHVLAKGFGQVVPEYAAVADELGSRGVLPPEAAARLRLMARYRNRMAHFYDEITPRELFGILTEERGDVEEILTSLQRWLAAHPELCDEAL